MTTTRSHRMRQTQQPYTGTRRILGKDGSWHTTSYRAAPVTEGGTVYVWIDVRSKPGAPGPTTPTTP